MMIFIIHGAVGANQHDNTIEFRDDLVTAKLRSASLNSSASLIERFILQSLYYSAFSPGTAWLL